MKKLRNRHLTNFRGFHLFGTRSYSRPSKLELKGRFGEGKGKNLAGYLNSSNNMLYHSLVFAITISSAIKIICISSSGVVE